MAEYIDKAEAIKTLCKGCNGCNPLDYPASFCINREEMVELPTIDIPTTWEGYIGELHNKLNALEEENEKLKNKLWEIEHIARGEVK